MMQLIPPLHIAWSVSFLYFLHKCAQLLHNSTLKLIDRKIMQDERFSVLQKWPPNLCHGLMVFWCSDNVDL